MQMHDGVSQVGHGELPGYNFRSAEESWAKVSYQQGTKGFMATRNVA
jgi:hypothetical protein